MVDVLIVDDDAGIRDTVRWALEDAGYSIQEASDGYIALDILRHSDRRLIVLVDQHMPRMDGLTLLNTIASEGIPASQHVFVLLSASRQPVTHPLLHSDGASANIVLKPFDIDDLVDMIERSARALGK